MMRKDDPVALGIDIGGTGIKGAPVDLRTGEFLADRCRAPTPKGAAPDAIATVVSSIVEHFGWDGPVGATFPAIVRRGVIGSAANVSDAWLGVNAEDLFSAAAGVPFTVVNDADAAGLSEMALGAGRGQGGLVIMATLGTGIGSALFVDGTLVPNTELGHLFIEGRNAEQWASARARDREQLSWRRWARRLTTYFGHLERLFSPELFIIGGGVSRHHDKYFDMIEVSTPLVPAHMLNRAGIVGAAHAAAKANLGAAA